MSDFNHEDLMRELLQTFQVEAQDHLRELNQSLLELERSEDDAQKAEQVQVAFRAAHSLKGAARAVNLTQVESLSHAMENILHRARDNGLPLTADICDLLYDTLDGISAILDEKPVESDELLVRLHAIATDQPPPPAQPKTTQETQTLTAADTHDSTASRPGAEKPQPEMRPAHTEDTIRVSVKKLDDLMAQVGELLVAKISADQRLTDVRAVRYELAQWSKTWRELKGLLPRMNTDIAQQFNDVLERHRDQMQSLTGAFNHLDQSISRDTLRLSMVTSGLQDQVRHVRMVPFHTIVLPLERAVRDASRSAEKPVEFQVQGSDVELDKKMLEMLKDPLLHLLRNAVGHGIETAAERRAAGKPAAGEISLIIQQRGSEVRIIVKDDGCGFDLDGLRNAYAQRSGITLEATAASDDVINLAFQPGVSTSHEVTTLSGRGIGLDVVRKELEAVQGRIRVDSAPGEGSSIELTVPTSLTMTRGLLLRVGKEQYVLPLLAVEKIVEPDTIVTISGKQMLKLDDAPLPLVSLANILERNIPDELRNPHPLAIIMRVAEQQLAILVDDVLTEQELAVKPLGEPLRRVRNIAGTALLGNGDPVIILNPADLMRSARSAHRAGVPVYVSKYDAEERVATQVLVVDDSITTRTLEKNILEAAGYQVITATDGTEAVKKLKEVAIDVVVSDIQMPQMDGIQLVRTLRDSSEYSELPIILVTSLESREDREQGMLAGADAYIVKRGFDQAELLATIERLTG